MLTRTPFHLASRYLARGPTEISDLATYLTTIGETGHARDVVDVAIRLDGIAVVVSCPESARAVGYAAGYSARTVSDGAPIARAIDAWTVRQ